LGKGENWKPRIPRLSCPTFLDIKISTLRGLSKCKAGGLDLNIGRYLIWLRKQTEDRKRRAFEGYQNWQPQSHRTVSSPSAKTSRRKMAFWQWEAGHQLHRGLCWTKLLVRISLYVILLLSSFCVNHEKERNGITSTDKKMENCGFIHSQSTIISTAN
jgi:hypothetical protein